MDSGLGWTSGVPEWARVHQDYAVPSQPDLPDVVVEALIDSDVG